MKKILSFCALSAIVLGMASCGDGNDPALNNVPEGAVKGVFTVENGKRVYFSKGNLQFKEYYFLDMQSGGKWIERWQFAEEQYEIFGDKNSSISISVLSQNDERTIDLFGWGTGDNPKKHTTKEADYTTFTEWGNNPIFNGGNTANQWRTLKSDEWDYLFLRRDRANELFGFGKVHGVKGLIILPDGWQKRKGMPDFTAVKDTEMKSASYGGYKDDMDSNHYADNDLSDDEWNALKESGAVFLPAGGWREGSGIAEVGAYGRYWSADPYSVQGKAADIYFEKYRMGTQGGADFYYGASVRLVQDVK